MLKKAKVEQRPRERKCCQVLGQLCSSDREHLSPSIHDLGGFVCMCVCVPHEFMGGIFEVSGVSEVLAAALLSLSSLL